MLELYGWIMFEYAGPRWNVRQHASSKNSVFNLICDAALANNFAVDIEVNMLLPMALSVNVVLDLVFQNVEDLLSKDRLRVKVFHQVHDVQDV